MSFNAVGLLSRLPAALLREALFVRVRGYTAGIAYSREVGIFEIVLMLKFS
jgi:hypothetical protein